MKKQFRIARFNVNAADGTLSNCVLLEAHREAKGHGLYIDAKTLSMAAAAIAAKGGRLAAAIAHPTWSEQWDGTDRILDLPGVFEGIKVDGDRLIAATFTFFETFRQSQADAYARLMEMAAKAPDIFGLSIESQGFAVYVGKDGTEYGTRPDNVELQHDGLPVYRITDVSAAAFVAQPAATSGLFARFAKALGSNPDDASLRALFTSFRAWADAQAVPQVPNNKDQNDTMNALLKALKAKFAADQAKLARATLIALNAADPDKLTVEQIEADLAAADLAATNETLRADLAKAKADAEKLAADKLAAEKAKAEIEAKFKGLRESGHPGGDVPLGFNVGGRKFAKESLTGQVLASMEARGALEANFAITGIADLWTPQIWIKGVAERPINRPVLLTSGIVQTSPDIVAAASGGGTKIEIPFFKPLLVSDEIQVAGTGPTINNVASGRNTAAILNRVTSIGAQALAGAVSGSDPVGYAVGALQDLRLRQRQATLLAILRGLFGTGATNGCLNALRRNVALETTAGQAAANWIDGDKLLDACALLGEAKERLINGAIFMHSFIETQLNKLDKVEDVYDSQGNLVLKRWRGIPIYVSDLLSRAGTTSGTVYQTYILSPGSVLMGDKPQTDKIGEAASLTFDADAHKNDLVLYDRTRSILHVDGTQWTGTPAGQSATNAELQTVGNWALAFADAKSTGIAALETNG